VPDQTKPSGFAPLAPVHATLLPPGTLGPDGVPVNDFRIMLFGRADDRVKAAVQASRWRSWAARWRKSC
jgi:hypothetical protein